MDSKKSEDLLAKPSLLRSKEEDEAVIEYFIRRYSVEVEPKT